MEKGRNHLASRLFSHIVSIFFSQMVISLSLTYPKIRILKFREIFLIISKNLYKEDHYTVRNKADLDSFIKTKTSNFFIACFIPDGKVSFFILLTIFKSAGPLYYIGTRVSELTWSNGSQPPDLIILLLLNLLW